MSDRIKDYKDISEINPPEKYLELWKKISLSVQKNKATVHGLTQEEADACFKQLCRRPYYLCSIAKEFGVKNIAEVGTAEGLQFFSFAEMLKGSGGHVWSCDILDKRNKEMKEVYKDNTTFVLGDSSIMAAAIKESSSEIDMFYIDGAHDYGDVIRDVYRLKEVQSDNPIWVFDDYDERFGCYKDITMVMENRKDVKVYHIGNVASGNPSHQVIIRGRF